MSTEQFDKKIKKALEEQSPAFDKKAWDRMEQLLDKHLPVKKDKDRRIFFILLFLFIAGGSIFLFQKINNNNQQQVAHIQQSSVSSTSPVDLNKSQSPGYKTGSESTPEPKESAGSAASSETIKNEQANTLTQKEIRPLYFSSLNSPSVKKNIQTVDKNRRGTQTGSYNQVTNLIGQSNPISKVPVNEMQTPGSGVSVVSEETDLVSANHEMQILAEDKNEFTEEDFNSHPEPLTEGKKPGKQKNESSFLKNFFVSASAGADVSMVASDKTGEVKLVYGAGLGYQISKRFAIRTGFYVTDKVYSAAPENYHPDNPVFWTYYPNLKHVDADCRVYEVPLVVDYSFAFKKNHSWFASAGLSSLFMKKEEYEYYFKPNSSPNYIYYSRTYENENKHYFSILSLSGGFTGNLNNRFSLRAEPYFKIALTGIGYGNVKLNSGGLLVSAIYRPFGSGK
jgi:cytoskeletal protein RodZ